jgi:putative ATP-binding cassette transporter
MRRLDHDLRDAYSLAIPYWNSEERWAAAALLGAIVALNVGLVGTTVLFTYWQGAFYNALEAKNWAQFMGSLFWWSDTPRDGVTLGFGPVLAAFVVITSLELYLRQKLQIRWRRWMTRAFVDDWLTGRAYLRMALLDSGTDNPDQRIAEDVRLYIDNTLVIGLGLIRSIVALISFVFLLWQLSDPIVVIGVTIHGYLVWISIAYAILGTWVTHLVGRRLTPLHFVQQRAEADFRFSLMRLSKNGEAIAFHRGEEEQLREFSQRFTTIAINWQSIMSATLRLTLLTSSYGQVMLVFPLAVVAPRYFAGMLPLGGIFQISNAFVQVQGALSWVVTSYADLTVWLATVERLAGFSRSVAASRVASGPAITVDEAEPLELVGVALVCPDGRSLLRDVDLRIVRGDRLLIKGPSGVGKSTLLRAIAGIWPFGTGTIRSASGRQLFVPQRPYMPFGTLKRAACYPASDAEFSDIEVAGVLGDTGLKHLVADLYTTDEWERRLSGGEQQRLSAARALLNRPDWLFLDEATSGLDPTAEVALYSLLLERLPFTTLVSVAHRIDLARFHTRVLSIGPDMRGAKPTAIDAAL